MSSCPCDIRPWPPVLAIPAGLADLPRQLVDFLDLRTAMFDRTRHQPALAWWSARGSDDFGVMLLELWAYVGELLSLYDKAIADETYVRTAKLRPSLRRTIALLGYVPRPAVAATAELALIVDGAQPITAPAGAAFRSGAFGAEPPQRFELVAPAALHPALNRWPLAAPIATTVSGRLAALLVDPASVRLAIDDHVLVELGAARAVRKVIAIERVIDSSRRLARVVFDRELDAGAGVPVGAVKLRRGTRRSRLRSASITAAQAYLVLDSVHMEAQLGAPILVERDGEARWTQVTARAEVDVAIGPATAIPAITFDASDGPVTIAAQTIAAPTARHTAVTAAGSLDAPALVAGPGSAAPGSAWIGAGPDGFTVHLALADAARVVGATRTTLVPGDPLAAIGLRAPVGSAAAAVTSRLALRDAEGTGAVIGGAVDWAAPALAADPAAAFPPLAVPVEAFGNVVTAVRGETVDAEVLGSGDASAAGQTFALAKRPLTYVAVPGASGEGGVRSTLRIWVDGLEWFEVPSFYGQPGDAPVFTVRQDDAGASIVAFGDGVRGARLPTGAGNVVARYRFGAGAAAPPAGSITQLAKPIAGVRSVVHPVAASGGADAEPAASLRTLAPRSALLLGRAISIDDMEVAARLVPGVVTARADWRWDGTAQRPVVKVWFVGAGDLAAGVSARLRALADPATPIHVAAAAPVVVDVAIDLELDPRRVASEVLAAADDAVRGDGRDGGLLTPAVLGIGQPVIRSRLVADLLAIPGVTGVRSIDWGGAPLAGYGAAPGDGAYFELATSLEITGS